MTGQVRVPRASYFQSSAVVTLPEKQSSSSFQSPAVTTLPSPSGKQSTSNLQDSKKWYQLGIQLDIHHAVLDAIGKTSADDEEKLICVLYKWMHNDESLESIKGVSI